MLNCKASVHEHLEGGNANFSEGYIRPKTRFSVYTVQINGLLISGILPIVSSSEAV
jgi:hypothetical protein